MAKTKPTRVGYRVLAEIAGLVPVMFDRFFNVADLDQGSKKKAKLTWKQELDLKIYKDTKGVYAPTDNIRMMLIGNQKRTGACKILGSNIEKGKGTEYINFAKACIWVIGPKDPLKVYFSPKRKNYDTYDERSFINAQGSRGITRRPLINTPWKLTFFVDVTDPIYDPSKIKEFFDVAGTRCGLGAYGPTFGRFTVTAWDVVE